jgi:EAL domain-containing protein (putative c-di-GMP-specific phosphodiesterase class I)
VAINVSATQFLRGNVAKEIRSVMKEFHVAPGILEIELTESVLMENIDLSRQQLSFLRDFGIRVAIDDFGTGYSSMHYLHKLPIDKLKIDQSFVQKIDAIKGDPIVTAIVELAKNLGLTVVAEGVETEAQRMELNRLGCDLLQGYLFWRPMPASDLTQQILKTSPTHRRA